VDPPAPRTIAAFGGNWIYSPSAEVGRRRSVYVPEFIELKILEKDGQLRGEYRARYLVTDRAISPAVVFHFEGRASPPRSTLPWKGDGGAYGRVTLRMADENSLEVTWTATKLSEDLGLISGTATLMRGREP
jgi:hypothetical protein